MLWDFSIGRTVALVGRTWPYLLLRAVVFGISALMFVTMVTSGGILGHQLLPIIFAEMSVTNAGVLGVAAGVCFGIVLLRILREYTLYLVKAGHIAVLLRLHDDGMLPAGKSQIGYGFETTKTYFAEASALFVLDQLIKAVLAAIRKTLSSIGRLLPGLSIITDIVGQVVEMSITFIDEIILAHIIRTKSTAPWQSAADAVVLYAQNGKLIVKNAAWLAGMLFIITLIVFAVAMAPIAYFFDEVQGPSELYAFFGTFAAFIFVLHVVMEPLAFCAMLQVFTKATAGQTLDPDTERQLSEASQAYRTLRAQNGMAPSSVAGNWWKQPVTGLRD